MINFCKFILVFGLGISLGTLCSGKAPVVITNTVTTVVHEKVLEYVQLPPTKKVSPKVRQAAVEVMSSALQGPKTIRIAYRE